MLGGGCIPRRPDISDTHTIDLTCDLADFYESTLDIVARYEAERCGSRPTMKLEARQAPRRALCGGKS